MNQPSKHNPPRWATRLLRWYCDEDWVEEITGDLEEAFCDRLKHEGPAIARRQYIQDVFTFLKPTVVRRFRIHQQYPPMIRNYFRIGLRSLLRKKYYALINSFGLVLGLCCVCLAFLYLSHEVGYDTFHSRSDRTYRVSNKYRDQAYANLPFPGYNSSTAARQQELADEIEQIEGVEAVTHFVTSYSTITEARETNYVIPEVGERFIENSILYTNRGKEFLEIFDWPVVAGGSMVLDQPYTALISTTLADKYFGKADSYDMITGRLLTIDSLVVTISGVMEPVPSYSHVRFDIAVHIPRIPAWGAYTYLAAAPEADPADITRQVDMAYLRLNPDRKDDPLDKGRILMPLEDIHLQSDMLYELQKPGDVRYLYLCAIAGLIILCITVTNYTNLSIAMYAGRQKEVGLRKVMGARRREVAGQFLFEAVLLSFLCLPFALALLSLVLPFFNYLMDMQLKNDFVRSLPAFASAFALTVTIGLLSGLWPSLALSRRRLSRLFHSTMTTPGRGVSLRHLLVGFQLTLIIALGSGAYFIDRQMAFMADKDLGFDEERIMYFPVAGWELFQPLREKLLQIPEVEAVGTGSLPGSEMFNQTTYTLNNSETILSDGQDLYMDMGLMEVLGIEHPALALLAQGREQILLVNRTAAGKLAVLAPDLEADVSGQTLVIEPEYISEEGQVGFPETIDGVIEDFHFFNLREKITPMFLHIRKDAGYSFNAVVKTRSGKLYPVLDQIERAHREVMPGTPFDVSFMDDRLAGLYEKEQQISRLTTALSLVSISLSVLGLLGLVSFMTYRRRSEISIRKVFGASVSQILLLVNREFMYMVGVATLIAAPLTYLAVEAWLERFAYRIEPGWIVILLAGVFSLAIVMIVVTLQSLKEARKNPASVLRQE
ncbi:MAG: FtsX-like permease family protein [Cyclobacteriaceae bacterium]